MSIVLCLPHEMYLSRSSSNVSRLPSFLKLIQNPHVLFILNTVHNPLRLPHKLTSERPKVLRTPKFSRTFDFEMCFAPQRRALFDMSTSKSGPSMACFVHFDFEMCFATSQLPKVVRAWCALCILTSKCASRHNRVHFFDISTSKSAPNATCF